MCYGKSFERTLVRVAIAYLMSLITHFSLIKIFL